MPKINWGFWLEWSSTAVLTIGVALTAWNIYPLNVYFSLAGNVGWILIGIMWRKWSLIVVQIILTAIYIAGLLVNT